MKERFVLPVAWSAALACHLYPFEAIAQPPAAAVKVNPLREAYYGDLHLHTDYSFDAYLYGARVDPEGAYRFARGEPGKFLDEEVKRSTPPLDFMAVTDHAEWLGAFKTLEDPDSALSHSEIGKDVREGNIRNVWNKLGWKTKQLMPLSGVDTRAVEQSAWQRTIAAANRHYQPGKFTTFIAYEWTASPGGYHNHRNVIFRGDRAPQPFSAVDSSRPEDLWHFLETIRKQGCEALAIPHNPNLSNGLTFDWIDSDGRPIDQTYAELRAANEPLVEIVQNKGQSETHPLLAPNDEFSSFELFTPGDPKVADTIRTGDVRSALGRGLELAHRTGGVNPFKYGFVGGSDFHNGMSDSAEAAYAGTGGAFERNKILDLDKFARQAGYKTAAERAELITGSYVGGSGGLTGVWSERNTRESVFAALRRRETFATSGTRLKFRFFGGWALTDTLLKDKGWVAAAYRAGVPMGADLPPQPAGRQAPAFAAWAVKDPSGANLDRLQVVKVWVENGRYSEKIYDIALSNTRRADPKTGKVPAVGNTVDLKKASYTNTIGATELAVVWRDPEFDPKVPAVYYLRVLEIPTPRWSTIDAVKRGQSLPKGVPPTLQERGWSSPIWFTPAK